MVAVMFVTGMASFANASGPRSIRELASESYFASSRPALPSLAQSLDRTMRERTAASAAKVAKVLPGLVSPAKSATVRLGTRAASPAKVDVQPELTPFPTPAPPPPQALARAERAVVAVKPAWIAPPAAATPIPPSLLQPVKALVTTAVERSAGPAPAVLLPVEKEVGLAAFRLRGELLVVLDAAIDFRKAGSELDQAFAQLSAQRTQDATLIRVPLAASAPVHFLRNDRGWVIALSASDTAAGIKPRLLQEGPTARLRIALASPSRAVVVIDPQTGGRLLIGTQGVPGQQVFDLSKQAQYTLLPSLQGVVIASTSNEILLRREGAGFTLSAGSQPGGTIVSDADPQKAGSGDVAPVSQLLDLPNGTTEALSRRLAEEVLLAAKAPAQARSEPRRQVAATMTALGMGAEAQSVLDVAAADDPAFRETPRAIGLRAAASILAHRENEADTLTDPRLAGTQEIELWRALLHVARDQATVNDAHALQAGLPVLTSYAPALRDRLLSTALETMALNGEAEATQATLNALPDRQDLDLARAMAFEALDQPDAALRLYDQVALRSGRLPRYRALVRAVDLRMTIGTLDAKSAADALDRALFAWRNAHEELPLRLNIARLRRQAGQWPEAMTVLRDGRAIFPDDHLDIDQEIAATISALFAGDGSQRMAPSDFVSFYDKNLDLLQTIVWPNAVAVKLIDRLLSLGLQGRAEPVLVRLLSQATESAERSALGAQLAALRMSMDDPAGAIAALADTAAPTAVDPSVIMQRQLLYARAEFARGNNDAALSILSQLDSEAADEQTADIQTKRKDWPQAVLALTALEHRSISDPDNLTFEQQALVMRLAEAATLGSDSATLGRVIASYGAAMAKSSSAPLFRLIGSAPVRSSGDLPRAYEEIEIARKVRSTAIAGARR